jgi:Zn-dependent protease
VFRIRHRDYFEYVLMNTLTLGMLWYIILLVSTICHEAAHALAAYWGGDRTAYEGGQVSLSPIPHIRREPIGMVLMPLISYAVGGFMIGWASAPYDPRWAGRHPNRAAWMALAGPAANFTLMFLGLGLAFLGLKTGFFAAPQRVGFSTLLAPVGVQGYAGGIAAAVSILIVLNLTLGTFNLIPLPPLDGASAIRLVLTRRMGQMYWDFVSHPAYALFGLFIAWKLYDRMFDPLFDLLLRLLYPHLVYG